MNAPAAKRGRGMIICAVRPEPSRLAAATLDPWLAYRQIDTAFCIDRNGHKIPGEQRADNEVPGSERTQKFVPGELFEIEPDKP